MLLKLPAGFAPPALPALRARHDPLLVELKLRLRARLRLLTRHLAGRLLTVNHVALTRLPLTAFSIPAQLLLGIAKELTPTLRRAQLLGQLITTLLTELLILSLIGRLVLAQDPRAICSKSRVRSEFAFPASRVPSIATNPGFTSPA